MMQSIPKTMSAILRVPGGWSTVRDERRAKTLHTAHLFIFFGTFLYFLLPAEVLTGQLVFVLATSVYAVVGSILLRLGYIGASALWTTLVIWIVFAFGSFTEGAVTSSSFAGTLAIVVFGGLIYGMRGALALAVASIVTAGAGVYLLTNNLLPAPAIIYSPLNIFSDYVVFLLFTAIFTGQAISSIDSSTARFEQELEERKRAEKLLTHSEQSYREIFNSTSEAIIIFHWENGAILDVNDAMLRMYGFCRKEEILGKQAGDLCSGIPPYSSQEADELVRKVPFDGSQTFEWHARRSDGQTFWVEISLRGTVIGGERRALAVIRDITDRRHTQEMLKDSLREKEALLKEIHHRVKNNLQVVSSLLNLQSAELTNGPVQEAFRESQNRIKSMALIHEKLYRSDSLSGVDFDEYLHAIVGQLIRTYGKRSVHARIEARETILEIEKAIPCGLIVNELISNAIKHGFPEGQEGVIDVRLSRDDSGIIELVVHDSGVGLAKDLDPFSASSLGLTLVRDLTDQLGGQLEISSNGGTRVRISFQGSPVQPTRGTEV
jgi:PAS domain S-box-containing protein